MPIPAGGTKERILDASERLLAERGLAGTSLRSITAAAGVNLAAVHYHFGSKEELLRALFARRLEPLNRERLRLLDRCEAGSREPSIEALLDAFVGPPLRLGLDPLQGWGAFMRLLGRISTEPGEAWRSLFYEQFQEVRRRFARALARALPGLPPADLAWRFHFVVGVLSGTLADPRRIEFLSEGICDASDSGAVLRAMVPFLAAGLRAPASTRRSRAR